jgi:hypothetical protein
VATARAFVTVRFPRLGVVFAAHTRGAPGTRVDGVLESTSVQGESVRYSILALVRGFSPEQFQAILAELHARYGSPPQVLERDDATRQATIRYGIAIRDMKAPGLQALVRFQSLFGVPWTRVEDGEVSMCGEAPGWDEGEGAAYRIRQALAELGIDADVDVHKLSPNEGATYDRLQELLGRYTWSQA